MSGVRDNLPGDEREHYPPAVPKACSDCPWRKNAIPGWLGPHKPNEWLAAIHSESAIACHQTIKAGPDGTGDWDDPSMRQCMGAAMFRHNVCKRPRHPEHAYAEATDDILENEEAFLDLHDPERELGDFGAHNLFDLLAQLHAKGGP